MVRSARQIWHCQWLQLMKGLGPADRDGHYRRQRPAVPQPPPQPASASPGDHVLIVGRSCPWAHRAWLTWTLRGLAPAIELLVVEPDPEAGRWRFSSPFEGCATLAELYRRGGCDPRARATVPLLWSRWDQRVLVSESARLIELLDRWPAPTPGTTGETGETAQPAAAAKPGEEVPEAAGSKMAPGIPAAISPPNDSAETVNAASAFSSADAADPRSAAVGGLPPDGVTPRSLPPEGLPSGAFPPGALCPPQRREQIQAWRQRLQGSLNDGVYRCGLARSQAAYDAAEAELIATLQAVEEALALQRLAGSAWLCGGADPSLADVCLFATLIRWEMVYAPLFGCGRQPLWLLPELWRWRARFYQLPGVAATCRAEAWRRDYFGALFPLHPSGIIPAGPDLATLVLSTPPQRLDDQ